MVEKGNPNSITDGAVGALCARAAVRGCALNVKVNAVGIDDKVYVEKVLAEANELSAKADALEAEIMKLVQEKMGV
jgi:glutamate formiminotransferase/formiminotetrahydrofolate cyclodeaminase